MSRSVDERVVEMQFDNSQFESGIRTSMKSLDNLKKGLNFDAATKSITTLQKTGNSFSLSGLEKGVDLIASKFTNLGIVGATALQRITNAAITAGTNLVKSLSLDPILTGFTEYETKMNAITTILTNTASKGTTLEDVNAALNELNTYADKTIYNFAEMTRNVGTFTAAGVDLETATKAIQGIANLAAGSGSSSAQASSAMYQLSQAIAAGRVSLQDWNSVVNAGMGGELFQNALKETAKQMGIIVDESVSFRESISAAGGNESWLTSDVLVKTLEKFAEDESLLKAATQVRTFTQLIDTMKESVQSGWAQSWEYIIGDREQAAELFTAMSEGFNSIIQPSTDARNAALQFWNANGGREAVIQGLSNVIKTLGDVLSPIGEAFDDAFPDITGERLVDISNKFLDLTKNFKIGDATAKNIKNTFSGLLSVIQMFGKGISAVIKPVFGLTDSIGSIGSTILSVTGTFGAFLTELNNSDSVEEAMSKISSSLDAGTQSINGFIKSLLKNTGGVGDFLSDFASGVADVLGTVASKLSDVIKWISENVSIGDIFAGLAGGGIFVVAKKLAGVFQTIQDALDDFLGNNEKVSSLKENFADILSSVHDSLDAFTTGIKVSSLLTIAVAIGVLSMSLNSISKIKSTSIAKSLGAIGVLMAELNLSFRSIVKSLDRFDSKGIVRAGVTMMTFAAAIKILTSALEDISALDTEEIVKGLAGIAGMMTELALFLKATDLKSVSIKGAVGLIGIAAAIAIISGALKDFSSLSWDEIARGLTAMGVALLELVAGIKIIGKSKVSISTSIALITLAESCKILADAVEQFGSLSWSEIGKGLTAMGVALTELVASVSVLGKFGGVKSLLGSGAILIAVQALEPIAETLERIGALSWEEIGKGLTAMGVALAELGVVSGVLGKLTGFSGILGGGSILIAAQSLEPIAVTLSRVGSLSWDEIGKGLTGMGLALAELGVVSGVLGKLSGFSGILGSGSLLIGVQALGPIAEALKNIGSLSWEEIGRGLVGMGGALVELGVVSGLLGVLSPLSVLGSGSLLIGVQGLGDLAEALKKFGSMDWDTIKQGLAAMGAAMGETALGGLLNTLSGFGAAAISEIAPALGTLADSLSKWKNVSVPENLGLQLGTLADGIMKFTFGGLGSGALATAAPAVGEMADAIKKWQNVTVPEGLENGLTGIANGVKKFSFAFMGGWSLDAVVEPLGQLASSVKKWNGVTIPEGLGEKLASLADGIGEFSLSFVAGWSIGEVAEPLKQLASSVKSWNGITIPEGIGTGLSDLAKGLSSFNGLIFSGESFTNIGTGLRSISNAASSLAEVDLITAGTNLRSFSDAVKSIPTELASSADSITAAISGISTSITSASPTITNAFTQLMTAGANAVSSSGIQFASAGRTAVSTLSNTMVSSLSSETSRIRSSMTQLINSVIQSATNTINSSKSKLQNGGRELIQAFINGMNSQKNAAKTAVSSIVSNASTGASGYYNSFYNAGLNMVQGLVDGIYAGRSGAIDAASSVAYSALKAAKDTLDIQSPSKEFEQIGIYSDQGMINGFLKLASQVSSASESVSESALSSARLTMERLPSILSDEIDLSPKITPVLDLNEVQSGYRKVSSLFDSYDGRIHANINSAEISSISKRLSYDQDAQRFAELLNKLDGLYRQNTIGDEPVNINFYGNYRFNSRDDIDYFMNQAALKVARKR